MTNAQYVFVGIMILGVLGQRFQFLPFKAAFGGFALAVLLAAIIALVALVVLALSFGFVNPALRSPMADSEGTVGKVLFQPWDAPLHLISMQ